MIIARFSYTLSIVLILTFIVGKVLILTLLESFCHVLNYVTHAQLVRHILYTSIAASLIGDALCTTPVTSSRSSWLINRNMRGSQFAARDGNKARAMKVNMDPSRRECRPSLQGTKESCEKNSGNTTLKSGIYKTSLWRCIFSPISYPRKWTIYSPYPPLLPLYPSSISSCGPETMPQPLACRCCWPPRRLSHWCWPPCYVTSTLEPHQWGCHWQLFLTYMPLFPWPTMTIWRYCHVFTPYVQKWA